MRVLRTEARLFTAQLSTWLVPRALFSKAARQAEGCAAFTPMRGPWRRNRTWCPCGVLGNHAFVCISTLLCPLPPPRHVCILSSSTFPSVWRRRFNFLPSYLIIPIVSNFSLISSLILDFGFWIFSQICFFSSLSRFFEFFLSILIFILFYYFVSIYLFYFIYILIFIVYSCSIPQSVLIVDFSFIIVSILLFYFSVNLSLEIFRFLLFVAIFVVAGLIDSFLFFRLTFTASLFLSFFPLLSFSSYFPRHAI